MAKSSRFTEKKLWNTAQIEKRQETKGKKREIRRPTWKPGPNQPWKKYGDFRQEIPRKQIAS